MKALVNISTLVPQQPQVVVDQDPDTIRTNYVFI